MKKAIDIKSLVITPLIGLIIKHPGIMENRLFLKVMGIFPGKIAGIYDQKVVNSGIDYKTSILEGLRHVRNDPAKILDVCAGTGFTAFSSAERFKDATIEAVDISPEMVRVSQTKAEEKEVTNVTFTVGNAMRLDYPDNHFDLVVTSNAPVYLEEAVRVLKPGGEILVAFSFAGGAFENAREKITELLHKNNVELVKLERAAKGAFILGKKTS